MSEATDWVERAVWPDRPTPPTRILMDLYEVSDRLDEAGRALPENELPEVRTAIEAAEDKLSDAFDRCWDLGAALPGWKRVPASKRGL
jgi:hypothetical protein